MAHSRPLLGMAQPTDLLSTRALGRPESDSVFAMLNAVSWMLRHIRVARELPIAEVAARCGVSASVLCRMELARRPPRLELLLMVCHELGVRFSDVMRFAENEAFPLGHDPSTGLSLELVARYAESRSPAGGDV